MSVRLESKSNEDISADICNADLAALCACARAYGESVPMWNGCHDGQEYSAEELRRMAARAKQIGDLHDALVELADSGPATVN